VISAWWLVLAFFGGSFAGLLLAALMHMSGEAPEVSANIPDLSGQHW
jgi:hypothetical protein